MSVPFFRRLPVRLAGMILLLGFIVVPLISELMRRAAEQIVLQQAEVQAATATIAVVESLSDVLRAAETTVRLVSQDLENRNLTPEEVDRVIRNVMASNPKLSGFGVSFESRALAAGTERFSHQLYRSGSHLVARDLAGADYQYWTRDWYTDAVARGGLSWTEPFLDAGGANAKILLASAPFHHQQGGQRVVAGVVTAALTLDWVRQLTGENEFFDSGYVIIFSRSGRLITHPDPKLVLTETMESLAQKTNNPELFQIYQRAASNRQGSISYLSHSLRQRVHENYKPVQLAGWGVVVGYEEKEFLRQVSAFRWITMVALAATLSLFLVIVLVSTRLALRPLDRLAEVSLDISRGKLDSPIASPDRDDEIGHLSRSFLLMQATLIKNRELEAKVLERTTALAAANESLRGEILERRWVNQSLEHQLRYDQLIINSFTDPVIVCTKALNISRVNPAVMHLTGWQPPELINTPLARLVQLEEAAGAPAGRGWDRLLQALKEGRDLRNEPALMTNRQGEITRVHLTLFPIRDRDKVVGGVTVLRVAAPPAPAA